MCSKAEITWDPISSNDILPTIQILSIRTFCQNRSTGLVVFIEFSKITNSNKASEYEWKHRSICTEMKQKFAVWNNSVFTEKNSNTSKEDEMKGLGHASQIIANEKKRQTKTRQDTTKSRKC